MSKNDNIENTNDTFDISQMFETLQKRISQLEQELQESKAQNEFTTLTPIKTLDDEVTIVNNQFSTIRGEFPTWKLSLSEFGQKYTISRRQFQELVNNKRGWFRKQYIVLDAKHLDLAEENGVDAIDLTSKKFIHSKDIKRFETMTDREIEEYYNDLSEPMKKTFATYFFNKCCEKDSNFFVLSKMNTVNRLIGGRLFDNLISVCANQQK